MGSCCAALRGPTAPNTTRQTLASTQVGGSGQGLSTVILAIVGMEQSKGAGAAAL